VEAEHAPKNVQIYNCRFRNIGVRAIKGSAGTDPNVRAIKGSVRFCDFENTRIPPANWLFGGDYIAGIDMMALEDWTFSDNIFRNIRGRNGGGRAAIFIWVRSRRIVVERNLIVNCDRGVSFGNPGQSTANQPGGPLQYVADGIIQNNLIAGGPDCGIELWHVEGIKVRHNSVWRPEQNWSRGIRVGAGVVQTEVVNNLAHGGIQIEGGEANIHHNLARRIEGYFVEPSSGDLSLTAAATGAIDQGVILNETPYDVRGWPRKKQPDLGAWEFGANEKEWVEPMRKVHARFRGAPGTFAQFGDSITFSAAFWSPLSGQPKNMTPAVEANLQLVKARLKPECLNQKGPSFGNQGSMTIQWARENISGWLSTLNPEVAVILFGSNDVAQRMSVEEYEKAAREVVSACLSNGTVVLLTTAPPQRPRMQRCLEFAAAIRRLTSDLHVPLVDYEHEILSRRPFDWDGASAEFGNSPGGTYEVPTLVSKDGVHPSNPRAYLNDFSDQALANSGYGLRNFLTMMAYANVIREVF
jgi:lysophospholipase L1-like esterase